MFFYSPYPEFTGKFLALLYILAGWSRAPISTALELKLLTEF